MILDKKQVKEFEDLSRPLVEFLNSLPTPYAEVTVDCGGAKITEKLASVPVTDYIKD